MRAIVVTENGGPEVLELRDLEDPQPGAGQLLVDVEAVGVNFRDIYEREGIGGYSNETPFVAGAEGAGTVAEVGDGVTDFAPGDRVAWAAADGATPSASSSRPTPRCRCPTASRPSSRPRRSSRA